MTIRYRHTVKSWKVPVVARIHPAFGIGAVTGAGYPVGWWAVLWQGGVVTAYRSWPDAIACALAVRYVGVSRRGSEKVCH